MRPDISQPITVSRHPDAAGARRTEVTITRFYKQMRHRIMHQARWLSTLPLVFLLGLPVQPSGEQAQDHPVTVTSSVMTSGETMPRRYTPDGRNLSPALKWSNLPTGTQELAVVCADFGAGSPPPWTHWLIYGIPATASGLPEGLPILADTPMPPDLTGAIQGLNGWRRPYYRGPAPPAGTPHLYHFTVYALDEVLGLPPGLTREELLDAIEGHVIGRGDLVPTYERF